MLEQYIFNKISEDETLQELLSAGSDGLHLYPAPIDRGIEFERAIAFSLLSTTDRYPDVQARAVQFSIFAKTHTDTATIAAALANLFNQDNNQSSGGVDVVFSIRVSEDDIPKDLDEVGDYFHRQATYNFKIR